MKAYGFDADALTVARGLLAASEAWQGRLPELFSGLDRADVETPVPFPTSCSPQAWSAATPFLLLRIMLGLEPDARGQPGHAWQPEIRPSPASASPYPWAS